MWKNKARRVEVLRLRDLRRQKLSVICGECARVHRASWTEVKAHESGEWIARSELHCQCGSELHSFIGTPVFMEMLGPKLSKHGIEAKPFSGLPVDVVRPAMRH